MWHTPKSHPDESSNTEVKDTVNTILIYQDNILELQSTTLSPTTSKQHTLNHTLISSANSDHRLSGNFLNFTNI